LLKIVEALKGDAKSVFMDIVARRTRRSHGSVGPRTRLAASPASQPSTASGPH
jgi:hypothetical protein